MSARHLVSLAGAALVAVVAVLCGAVPIPRFGGDEVLVEHLRQNEAVVERVVDGDTVELVGGERVRLLTIDAPELGRRGSTVDDECGAQLAADELALLLPPGTTVAVNGLKGEPDRDRYGRRLANLYLHNYFGGAPENVSLLLVRRGLARVYLDYPTSQTDDALTAQQRAQDAHAGIWATC